MARPPNSVKTPTVSTKGASATKALTVVTNASGCGSITAAIMQHHGRHYNAIQAKESGKKHSAHGHSDTR